MFVAVLAQASCPAIPEWLQAVRIYSRGYILTAFVYKDIWYVLADTPLFYEKNRGIVQRYRRVLPRNRIVADNQVCRSHTG